VGSLDDLAAGSVIGVFALLIPLLAACFHVQFVVVDPACGQGWKTNIGGIGAKRLRTASGLGPGIDDAC
jgi:hypothetical protein